MKEKTEDEQKKNCVSYLMKKKGKRLQWLRYAERIKNKIIARKIGSIGGAKLE